jgi:endonuclease/exonuclease/phosphatase (EEP) superfamily protein YafD
MSRLPLRALDTSPNRKGHAEPEVVVRVDGAPPVRVKAVHPAPPVNPTAAPFWQDALAALPSSDGRGDVQILAGDFNATLDHAELRDLLGRGYTDAADAVGKGLVWTWPARRRGRALPLTIDHILVDKRVEVERVEVVRVPRSDHRAVIATLRLPRA